MSKNHLSNVFVKSMPVVAMAMGDQMGIEVTVGGNQAATDGKTIMIPELPDNDKMWVLGRGFLDHEAAHIKHTDFRVKQNDQMAQLMTNAIEDVRIEIKQGAQYPGVAANLRKLTEHLEGEGFFTDKPKQNAGIDFMSWIATRSRADFLHHKCVEDHADKTEKRLRKVLGDDIIDKANKMMSKIPNLKNTAETAELAKKILALVHQEQQKQDGPGEGKGEGKGDQDQSGNPGQPQKDSGGKSAKQKALDQIANNKENPYDIGKHVQQELEKNATQNGETTGQYPGSEYAESNRLTPFNGNDVRARAVGMRSKMARIIQASKMKRSYNKKIGKYIDTRAIHKLAVKETRVFHAKEEKKAPNTAVVLLLDRSGSMDGQRMVVAREATYAIADALSAVPGVAVATAAFPGYRKPISVITPFGESPKKTEKSYGIQATGGTPMHDGLQWARTHLLTRMEPRKIVLVMTDGSPDRYEPTRKLIKRLTDEGVEVMGLGIQTQVSGLFKQSTQINNVEGLSKELFKMFTDVLKDK